jgi:hypothetical protein
MSVIRGNASSRVTSKPGRFSVVCVPETSPESGVNSRSDPLVNLYSSTSVNRNIFGPVAMKNAWCLKSSLGGNVRPGLIRQKRLAEAIRRSNGQRRDCRISITVSFSSRRTGSHTAERTTACPSQKSREKIA